MSEQNPIGHRLIVDWNNQLHTTEYSHKYGGIPSNGGTLPICSGCRDHYHLLFQIDLGDKTLAYLDLNDLDYLFLISCLNCATYEKPMYYTLNKKGHEIVILHESPGKFVHEYSDPLDEYRVSSRKLLEKEYPITDNEFNRLSSHEGKHQLCGTPIWRQREEHILCIKCGKEMSYFAMVDSELYIGKNGFREKGHMFGDEGILYVFICRNCGVFAEKAQGL